MSVLNNGQTPFSEGFYRGLYQFLIAFVYTAFLTYQGLILKGAVGPESERIRDAIVAGVIIGLAPFVTQTAMGASDQSRANHDRAVASDVPIAIAAKHSRKRASTIAADFAPEKLAA